MSIRQGAELDHAFERNGWTAEDVKWLSKGDILAIILRIRQGTAKVVPIEPSKPAPKPEPKPLLIPRGETAVPLLAGLSFVVRTRFIRNIGNDAFVKISGLGNNFTDWFLGKTEETPSSSVLRYADLGRPSLDAPIIEALGGEGKAEITLTEVFTLMAVQPNGEKGALLTSGRANVFYVRDIDGALRAVYVDWLGDGWRVFAFAVADPDTWSAGFRVFSRNSR
ncbi:MAG: hypothetical protein P4L67_03915 [Candidatus Pacebacteria bacterium]|nr:hypothetical protein [Candidatus Paceibacterota bacterium]